ncbi:Ephrin type-A receptor 3 [Cichlidogyrus casuarinus]|uniref:receptor protein-tyrosine kinase n=1 Tax=Cichlidogyrus casuarinus TaxID=1844966 RepID=A0ABD2QLR3_9PLAT
MLQRPDDDSPKLVAIKTLKTQATAKEREDFLAEASTMALLKHPNIIRLEGVVTKTDPFMIVTEYMSLQSLDRYLKSNKKDMSMPFIIDILASVANAMSYLAQMRFVHRDLAARNILLDDKHNCKVTDFGLSREVDFEDPDSASYTTMGGKIPVRWTAPESITLRKFTTASDVWSFGVLMWEVLSFGERPFWNWSNQAVLEAIESGYRLPAPNNCPLVLYKMMLRCWSPDRLDRPSFESLFSELSFLKKNLHALKELAPTMPSPFKRNVDSCTLHSSRRLDLHSIHNGWHDSGHPSSTLSRKSSIHNNTQNINVQNELLLHQQLQLQMQQILNGTLPHLQYCLKYLRVDGT